MGHIMMMKDPYMCSEIEKLIDSGKCAEEGVETVCDTFIAMFSSVDDEMTRQRAADVRDIKKKCCPFCSEFKLWIFQTFRRTPCLWPKS